MLDGLVLLGRHFAEAGFVFELFGVEVFIRQAVVCNHRVHLRGLVGRKRQVVVQVQLGHVPLLLGGAVDGIVGACYFFANKFLSQFEPFVGTDEHPMGTVDLHRLFHECTEVDDVRVECHFNDFILLQLADAYAHDAVE